MRRLLAEFTGTGLLVAVVVGSGIAAQRLSPDQVGLQLLENSAATVLGLAVLITWLGPVSGAHLNPVVTGVDWLLGRRTGTGLRGIDAGAYTLAQLGGALTGAVLANVMFDLPAIQLAGTDRGGAGHLLGEVVATAGLIAVILAMSRTGRTALVAAAVAAWIGTAFWFTSSTAFANPAATVGRMITDTFAGIGPASVPGFVAAQVLGGITGLALAIALHPRSPSGEQLAVPHPPDLPRSSP